MAEKTFSTAEKFLIIAHHPEKGGFLTSQTFIQYGIAGAILLDLTLGERISMVDKKLFLNKLLDFYDANIRAHPQDYRRYFGRGELLGDLRDGRAKLHVIRHALALRAQQPDLFRDGDYLPLAVKGERANHVCAYARRLGDRAIIAVVPRLTVKLLKDKGNLPLGPAVWGDTVIELPKALARRAWTSVLTGAAHAPGPTFSLGKLCADLPLALLVAD